MKLSLNLSFLISVGLLSVASVVSGEATDEANRQLTTKSKISVSMANTQCMADYTSCDFDFGKYCRDYAYAAAYSNAGTIGNAEAEADIWLCAESMCTAFEEAYATAVAFTVASGSIDVETFNSGGKKAACLAVHLDSAVTTFAFAGSAADATAFAAVDAYTFTSAEAYCQKVGKKQPYLCGGLAESGLVTFGVAEAGATAQAQALAISAAGSSIDARVWAYGTSLTAIKGLIETTASSWACADAEATTHALAEAFSETCVESFTQICLKTYEKVCSDPKHPARSICGQQASVSCAQAWTYGAEIAGACADACASGCATAVANSVVHAEVSANVDCSTDVATCLYTCAPADSWVGCR